MYKPEYTAIMQTFALRISYIDVKKARKNDRRIANKRC